MALLTIFHKLAILDREIIDEQYVNPTYFSKTRIYNSIISLEIYIFTSLKYRCNPNVCNKNGTFSFLLKITILSYSWEEEYRKGYSWLWTNI